MIFKARNCKNRAKIEPRRPLKLLFDHMKQKEAPRALPREPKRAPRAIKSKKLEKLPLPGGALAIKPDLAGERKAHVN